MGIVEARKKADVVDRQIVDFKVNYSTKWAIMMDPLKI